MKHTAQSVNTVATVCSW